MEETEATGRAEAARSWSLHTLRKHGPPNPWPAGANQRRRRPRVQNMSHGSSPSPASPLPTTLPERSCRARHREPSSRLPLRLSDGNRALDRQVPSVDELSPASPGVDQGLSSPPTSSRLSAAPSPGTETGRARRTWIARRRYLAPSCRPPTLGHGAR